MALCPKETVTCRPDNPNINAFGHWILNERTIRSVPWTAYDVAEIQAVARPISWNILDSTIFGYCDVHSCDLVWDTHANDRVVETCYCHKSNGQACKCTRRQRVSIVTVALLRLLLHVVARQPDEATSLVHKDRDSTECALVDANANHPLDGDRADRQHHLPSSSVYRKHKA